MYAGTSAVLSFTGGNTTAGVALTASSLLSLGLVIVGLRALRRTPVLAPNAARGTRQRLWDTFVQPLVLFTVAFVVPVAGAWIAYLVGGRSETGVGELVGSALSLTLFFWILRRTP